MDLNELLSHKNAVGITVGHNGSIYYYTKLEKYITDSDVRIAIRRTIEYNGNINEEGIMMQLAKQLNFVFKKM